MALGPKEMGAAIIANLPTKTGKSIAEWVALVHSWTHLSPKEQVICLKSDYGLGHVQAQTIVGQSREDYLASDWKPEDIFTGEAGVLYQTLHDQLVALGPDVQAKPCKTYVPFYTSKQQFAMLTVYKKQVWLAITPEVPTWQQGLKLGGSERMLSAKALSKPEDLNDVDWTYIHLSYQKNR